MQTELTDIVKGKGSTAPEAVKWNMTAGFTCAAASAAEAGGGWTTSSACRVLCPPRQSHLAKTTSIFKVQLRSVANNHHHLLQRIPDRETIHAPSALPQAPPTGVDTLLKLRPPGGSAQGNPETKTNREPMPFSCQAQQLAARH